jgi:hypothetical protein
MKFRVDSYKRHEFSIKGTTTSKTKTVKCYYAVCGNSSEMALGFDNSTSNFYYSVDPVTNIHSVGLASTSREISVVGTFTAASWDTYS